MRREKFVQSRSGKAHQAGGIPCNQNNRILGSRHHLSFFGKNNEINTDNRGQRNLNGKSPEMHREYNPGKHETRREEQSDPVGARKMIGVALHYLELEVNERFDLLSLRHNKDSGK